MSNWTEKVSTYMDGMWPSFFLIFACLPISDIVWQCGHVTFYVIVIQKLCWWRSTIWLYQPLLWRCRDGWGFVYFQYLPSLFCVLFVLHLYNSFRYVALPLHFPPLLEYPSIFEVNAKCFKALLIYTSCKNSITPRNSPQDGQTEASSSKVPVIVNCKLITLSVTDSISL